MKNFKRFAAAAAALAIVASTSACGEQSTAEDGEATTTTAAEEATTTAATTTTPKITTTTTTTLPPLPVMSEYEAKYEENEDLLGWIKVDGTPIDYPVMQAEDNNYYLYREFDLTETKSGSIFCDSKCTFTSRTRPANTILYGHNIADGSMFAKLTEYYPWKHGAATLSQYINYPTVQFDTIWEEGTYKIFAAMYVNTMEEHGEVFAYYKQRTIKNEGQFYEYIAQIMDRSVFYTDVDLEYGDELLTLSTCYYPLGKEVDSRFVVFARRVRDGESAEVDTSKAYINTSPLYFDYYYKVNGGKWAGRTWDTSKVKGFDEYLEQYPNSKAAAPTV